jgi:hypothetical protein
MAVLKYGQYVKSLPFREYGPGGYRQGTVLDSEFLMLDVHVQYGSFWNATKIGKSPYVPHTHDFDQIMLFVGSDMNDPGDLFAEVEMCLGEDMETYVFASSSAVAIPRGLPHMPATITRMDKRVILYVISLASKYSASQLTTSKEPTKPMRFKNAKYRKNIVPLSFSRKGAWYYGPDNRDDGGGAISFIKFEDLGITFSMIYECMKKAPYRLMPDPDKPHAHANSQVMLFLGTDADDISELGAEFEICMGKEQERHIFTTPTAVITPPYLPHWPGGINKLTKPIIFADLHLGGDSKLVDIK